MRRNLLTLAILALLPATVFASRASQCFGDICTNDSVVTQDRANGIVKRVFSDGTMQVQMVDGSTKGSMQKYSYDELLKPIKCLENICANDTVTTPDRRKAVVRQVFHDGIARVSIVGGGADSLREYSADQLSLK